MSGVVRLLVVLLVIYVGTYAAFRHARQEV
jgi:hypothetical protein